ncbi:hypothetical protein [Sulfitobacter sp. S190]|uniref:hypothetical protein n=1 Tax=Sulfitobacter sp. S190 TaxID=2867022 RepID=UPI0021A6A565|nr:hypothetical protein [Sulfitobacter sp. S190]UWR23071.1 hypothetical protein K3756_03465 [Sulfitobacter sp. S190]
MFYNMRPHPLPPKPRYIIDPVAFFVALIGGPLLFTLLSFWALFIPVFALVFGGPLYLAIGLPVLLWHLRNRDADPGKIGLLAFFVNLILMAPLALFAAFEQDAEIYVGGLALLAFGLIFAPAWGYFFGRIYLFLRRDFFARPRLL